MAAAGSGRRKDLLHREAPAPGFVARLLAGDELVEWDRAVARPNSARRAEVGDAALGRDAGAGERHDPFGFGDHVAETLDAAAKIRCNQRGLPFCFADWLGRLVWPIGSADLFFALAATCASDKNVDAVIHCGA